MADFRPHFGLQISDSIARIIQVSTDGKRYKLDAVGSTNIVKDAIKNYEMIDKDQLHKSLNILIKDSGITTRNVVFSIPESSVYSSIIEMPLLSESELENALKWEIEQYVPLPPGQVIHSHQILFSPPKGSEEKMQILLVAASKEVIAKYMDLSKALNLEPIGIESEVLSATRSLVPDTSVSGATLVANFGQETTDLAVVGKIGLSLNRSITSGSDAIIRAISLNLSIDTSTAESYMNTYGLDETQLEGKVSGAIKPVVDLVCAEIKRAIAYYQSKWPDDQIKRVILAGNSSYLPNLVSYMAQNVSLEVLIGDPLANIVMTDKQRSMIVQPATFAVPTGLALKEEK